VSGSLQALTRTRAFLRKETVEVVRQPRLLVTLVIGPFLILLLFGAGLRELDPPVRTLFVAPSGSELTTEAVEFAQAQRGRLTVEGVTADEDEALQRLRGGDLEMVVVFPEDVEETVLANEQATIRLYHTQIDPLEGRAVELFMQTAVDQINRQFLRSVVAEGQTETEDIHERVKSARDRSGLVRRVVAARAAAGELDDETVEQVEELDGELVRVDESLSRFRATDPSIAVAPFRGEAVRLEGDGVELSDFYAPAVVVVLLQHLLLTTVGLSLVREEELGTTQLYRVAPLRTGELVVGKYMAHMLMGGVIAAALLALLVFALGVPMAGSWILLAATVVGVLLASAGLGLLVAVASRSDSQAVQYAMMALLLTIFFSGFLLSIDRFFPTTRWVAYMLPATYGVELMRDVMLRGAPSSPWMLPVLLAIGLVLALVGWRLLRRKLRR
jgi:ABC-2 type transport system permease protein